MIRLEDINITTGELDSYPPHSGKADTYGIWDLKGQRAGSGKIGAWRAMGSQV